MIDELNEVWKDIETIPYHQAAWPFHQVSNLGRVRILPGGEVGRRFITETELRKSTLLNGYRVIWRGKRDHMERVPVHHLVLNQFVGPCPPGQECRHLNGNRSDNRLENLEWGTPKKNQEDRVLHGTSNKGDQNGRARLVESDIIAIRVSQWSDGELAVKYGVTRQAIQLARSGRTWKHVDVDDYKRKLSMKLMHLIPDMEPIEFHQMMLSFGG